MNATRAGASRGDHCRCRFAAGTPVIVVLWSMMSACGPMQAPVERRACATPDDLNAPADVTITARDTTLRADPDHPDLTREAWTFDGDVPGPILRIPLGETRRIRLLNRSPRDVSLHFHGVRYSADDDGTPEHPRSVVYPECAHVYTVTAVAPGVFPYHSHVDSRHEMVMGLVGGVVVPDPAEPRADREFVVVLSQLGQEEEHGGTLSREIWEDDPHEEPFFMVLNGRANGHASVVSLVNDRYELSTTGMPMVHVGERVRWRVLNLSPDAPHTFHVHGHRWCRDAAIDARGTCPPGSLIEDNHELFPAQGATMEYVEDGEGEWMYHCHVLDHVTDGMWAMYMSHR